VKQFANLSRIDKAFITILLVRVLYGVVGTATGTRLPGSGLIQLIFILAAIVFILRWFPRLVGRLLWRVRHRLLVTWVLLGVVPLALISVLVGEGLYLVMGQFVAYMTTTEVSRQIDWASSTAHAFAWSVHRSRASSTASEWAAAFVRDLSETRHAEVGAVVRAGNTTIVVPDSGAIREIPEWATPDFAGLINDAGHYYFAAHALAGDSAQKTEIFLYQVAPAEFFSRLLPNVATIVPAQGTAPKPYLVYDVSPRQRSGLAKYIAAGRGTRMVGPPGELVRFDAGRRSEEW
jgi:hypothetical protein